MGRDIFEHDKMKKVAILTAIEQLRLRGEKAIRAGKFERHDVLIDDKNVKIKIKFSKPIQRCSSAIYCWEFTKIIHKSRLWPQDIYHYYLLVGLNENGGVNKIWKVSTEDDIIYRKNQIFIPLAKNEDYRKYEMDVINIDEGKLQWID